MLIELLSGGFGAALVAGIFGIYQHRRDKTDATGVEFGEASRLSTSWSWSTNAKAIVPEVIYRIRG